MVTRFKLCTVELTIIYYINPGKSVVRVAHIHQYKAKELFIVEKTLPELGGLIMRICFPSNAPMQLGKCHLFSEYSAIFPQSSDVLDFK